MSKNKGFDALMHRLCVGMGWCGCMKDGRSLHVHDFIPCEGRVSAEQFTEWVLLADDVAANRVAADDLRPDGELSRAQFLLRSAERHTPFEVRISRWRTEIRGVFIEYMGAEEVDARTLRYSDEPEEPDAK